MKVEVHVRKEVRNVCGKKALGLGSRLRILGPERSSEAIPYYEQTHKDEGSLVLLFPFLEVSARICSDLRFFYGNLINTVMTDSLNHHFPDY